MIPFFEKIINWLEARVNKSRLEECEFCDGSGIVTENLGYCGGCEFCGSRQEKEKPCLNCNFK